MNKLCLMFTISLYFHKYVLFNYSYWLMIMVLYIQVRPEKINVVFPLSLPTLIFCANPKVFIAIFTKRLLKSDFKKSGKKNLPTYPIFFSNESRSTTLICLGLSLKDQLPIMQYL